MIDRRRTTAGADAAALLEQRAHLGDLHAAEHRLERLVKAVDVYFIFSPNL